MLTLGEQRSSWSASTSDRDGDARGRREHTRRGQPLRHADAVAGRRRRLTPALDPARHARLHPRARDEKINAAWAFGGPALTIKTVEALTGLKINHMIVVNLGNFLKFIDAIGGVTVKTPRICSKICGGAQQRRLHARPLARHPPPHRHPGDDARPHPREHAATRPTTTSPARGYQQQILNAIKSQLLSAYTFFHLPWASWDAPQAIQTDMGGLTLLQLFAASEIGGSAPRADRSSRRWRGRLQRSATSLITHPSATCTQGPAKLLNG